MPDAEYGEFALKLEKFKVYHYYYSLVTKESIQWD